MRRHLIGLSVVSLLSSGCSGPSQLASHEPAAPSAPGIEKLLRDRLADDEARAPVLRPYAGVVLQEFRLLELAQTSPSRWRADIELLLDFGPPPPSIMGFERVRRGRYRMVLRRQDGRLHLVRFYPVATVRLMPGTA